MPIVFQMINHPNVTLHILCAYLASLWDSISNEEENTSMAIKQVMCSLMMNKYNKIASLTPVGDF